MQLKRMYINQNFQRGCIVHPQKGLNMISKCGCGGELITTSNNMFYFIVRCIKCAKQYKQRKRQSKRKHSGGIIMREEEFKC